MVGEDRLASMVSSHWWTTTAVGQPLCTARQEVTRCSVLVTKASPVHGGSVAVGVRGTWGGQESMTEVATAALPALLRG